MNLLCTILALTCTSGTVTGPANVWDGDTIYIGRMAVRLAGIDAEELDEPHGVAARDHLRSLVAGRTITCTWQGWSYNRRVGICYAETVIAPSWPNHVIVQSFNLNAQMVHDGYALDCAYYSHGLYRQLEPSGARSRLIQKAYCK